MKRIATIVVPGLFALTAIVTACSTSNDPNVDPSTDDDAGAGTKDSGSPQTDPGTDAGDSGKSDANDGGDGGDDVPVGPADDIMKACARIDACSASTAARIGMNGCYRLLTIAPFAHSLDGKERAQLENLQCKLAATSCAEVEACDRPLTDFNAFCAQAEGFDYCSKNIHFVCEGTKAVAAVDCSAMGKICGADEFGSSAACGLAPCDPFEFPAPTSCNGNVLTQCQYPGLTQEIDCTKAAEYVPVKGKGNVTVAGTVCGQFGEDYACIGEGADCGPPSQKCDGTVLETCARGKLARRDCAAVLPEGQSCVVLEDVPDGIQGVYGCGPVNPTCKTTDNESCNPSTGVIGFCGLTGPKKIDCKELGYAGCKTTTVDGRVTAACFQ